MVDAQVWETLQKRLYQPEMHAGQVDRLYRFESDSLENINAEVVKLVDTHLITQAAADNSNRMGYDRNDKQCKE